MNSQFLKQWVNGAAFHTQMLIHQARLEGTDGSRATQAAWIYQTDLKLLLEKYKKYLESIISVNMETDHIFIRCCLYYNANLPLKCFHPREEYCFRESEIVETMFSKKQITWANTYFSDLAATIPTLVSQNGAFHI